MHARRCADARRMAFGVRSPASDWDSFCGNYYSLSAQGRSDDVTFQEFTSEGGTTYQVTAQDGVSARAIYDALKTKC